MRQRPSPRPTRAADIDHAYPLYGPDHGYDRVLPAAAGADVVCVYGINVGSGVNSTLGCRIVVVGGSPTGALDSVHTSPGSVQVTGWAIDPDTSATDMVHVYIDDAASVISAGGARPDIGQAFPLYGPNHGYSDSIPASAGVHRVCAYGINVVGAGGNTTLGCHTVGVPG